MKSNWMTQSQNLPEDIDKAPETDSEVRDDVRDRRHHKNHKPGSILQQVEQRTLRRKRRRKPPKWAVKMAGLMAALRNFFRTTLPHEIRKRRRELITAGISFLVHLGIGLILTLWLLPQSAKNEMLQLIGARIEDDAVEQPVELIEIVQPKLLKDLRVDSTLQQMLAELDKGPHTNQVDSPDLNDIKLPLEDLTDVPEIPFVKGQFGGRTDAGRRAAVAKFGGSAESEKAVSLGLTWLQKIQRADGSWSFAEVGGAGQPGNLTTTDMGATSLALLCFLGAGNTHETAGPYRETVLRGLAFLGSNVERGAFGADLRGRFQGNSGMYVQGIATICVCEASALAPKDKELRRLASDAVRFIEKAQHKVDGGWRYNPGDPGDTSVVGWQLMALQSAKSGRIKVQNDTIREAKEFLDAVAVKGGAQYSYMPGSGATDSMTAVGLLCRMYNGWKREKPELKAGVEYLAAKGPRLGDIYYNYYATQVVHHWGGELWKKWNLQMRDQLVSTQVTEGPGAGSWDVTDPHGSSGGRIYQTSLSILTLEVYYRHLPIYRRFDEQAAEANENVSAK
jgi:hypothetical protein